MQPYNPREIEKKWQDVWQKTKIYEAKERVDSQKVYATPMLPYPSGAGLHIGHVRNYSISDTVARYYRQRGHNVMTNIGWDSFGLPAENYAIKTGIPPWESTQANIKNFKKQLQRLGMSFAWERELDTSDPDYYRWTQWLFLQFFNKGLAYQAESLQWWCTKCKTVLANEQVVDEKCWRHDTKDDPLVEKRRTKQWFLKITDYADELLEGLDDINWPEHIKIQQRNWIGRSVGAEITFKVAGLDDNVAVFTTRPDTLYGATFIVLAPEHPLTSVIATQEQSADVEQYVHDSLRKTDVQRMDEKREKSGVFTGAFAINPINQEPIPIWVSDFVLGGYGTGAIMAVPGHDQRDNDFARKYDLPIVPVVAREFGEERDDESVVEGVVVIGYDPVKKRFLSITLSSGETWLCGGGLETGETYEQAAARELKEETGYTAKELIPLGDPVYSHYYNDLKKTNRLSLGQNFLAIIDSSSSKKTKREGHEAAFKTHWVTYRQIVQSVKKTGGGVEHWLDALERASEVISAAKGGTFIASNRVYSGEGLLIQSGPYDMLPTAEAREKITADLEKKKVAVNKVSYRMRDWLVSRQRYWGAPIPIIHCKDCGPVGVSEEDLPVLLPKVKNFGPTGETTSVLAGEEDWVSVTCPTCNKQAMRETDTLDGYVCSSWYMYRYTDTSNTKAPWDPKKANYWFPVDFYFGGDHAVAHLLYFRFWHRFFVDQGFISAEIEEPVKSLVYNGYINAADGRKMSKSLGNVVDPLEIIDSGYGADALRMFELFIGPFDQDVAWNPNGVPGTYRFIQRVWDLVLSYVEDEANAPDADQEVDAEQAVLLAKATHKIIKKVTDDLEHMKFNTAIAACMELVNTFNALRQEIPFARAHAQWRECLSQLLQLLAPFAPHVSEELWSALGHETSIHVSGWPAWDDTLIAEDTTVIVVQVNGKRRAEVTVAMDSDEASVKALAQADPSVHRHLEGATIRKVIFVPNRLINFVIARE